jgi:hypothetical protein
MEMGYGMRLCRGGIGYSKKPDANPMWRVTVVMDNEVVSTAYSHQSFRKTLFLAGTLVRGVPCAECCIRRFKDNHLAGWLQTDGRGGIALAEMSVQREHNVNVVTQLNPKCTIFLPDVA